MSRARTRARRIRARIDLDAARKAALAASFRAEGQTLFDQFWSAPDTKSRAAVTGELIDLFHRVAATPIRLWALVNEWFGNRPVGMHAAEEREEIEALVTRILRDHLAGLSLAEILRRRIRSAPEDETDSPNGA